MDQAKLGDRVNCPCKGGPHHIVTGASTVFVDGVPAARVGDKSSCGATITTGLDWYNIEGAPAAMHGSATSCGGAVGVGLDTMATREQIAEACTQGREQECRRTQFTEYGKLAGRTFGAAIGAAAGSEMCMVISMNPAGRIVCGVISTSVGTYGGAKSSEPAGEAAGEFIFESWGSDDNS